MGTDQSVMRNAVNAIYNQVCAGTYDVNATLTLDGVCYKQTQVSAPFGNEIWISDSTTTRGDCPNYTQITVTYYNVAPGYIKISTVPVGTPVGTPSNDIWIQLSQTTCP